MSHPLARKQTTTSLWREGLDAGSGPDRSTSGDQKPREKSAPYQDPRYRPLLEAKGSSMGKYVRRDEVVPMAKLFEDDFFRRYQDMLKKLYVDK